MGNSSIKPHGTLRRNLFFFFLNITARFSMYEERKTSIHPLNIVPSYSKAVAPYFKTVYRLIFQLKVSYLKFIKT